MKTCKIGVVTGCAVLLALGAGSLRAGTINIGTGQAPGVPGTASDPIWNIDSAPFGNTSGPAVLLSAPVWGAAPAGLDWIATQPDYNGTDYSSLSEYPAGNYVYETQFTGSDGVLSFHVKADNAVTAYLNGVMLDLNGGTSTYWGDPNGVNPTGWATFSPTVDITSGFASSGPNTLKMVVENNALYTGLLVQGSFTSASTTPEPATVAYLASGVLLVGLGKWRRRKQ